MNYYHRINVLPMVRFDLINRTGDLTLLLKAPHLKQPKDIELEVVWNRIYTEFLDTFKLNYNFQYWKKLKKQHAQLVVESYDNKSLATFAEIKKREAFDFIEQLQGGNLSETQIKLENYYKKPLNPSTETVLSWFTLLNEIK